MSLSHSETHYLSDIFSDPENESNFILFEGVGVGHYNYVTMKGPLNGYSMAQKRE